MDLNLDRVIDNLNSLRAHLNTGTGILAVVKSNAYGHGLTPLVQTLAPHVQYFGVANLTEALAIRDLGIALPILIFGHLGPHEVARALEWDLTVSVSDLAYGGWVQEEASRIGVNAKVHVKIDTGMGRFGFPAADAVADILALSRMSRLKLEGLYTHFSQAELANDTITEDQIQQFDFCHRLLRKEGLVFEWVHASNSAGIIQYPHAQFNMVRPGLALYGCHTVPYLRDKISLKPVMSLKARWVLIKTMKRGQAIGYGRSHILSRDTNIGILPVGYGHGYPFALSDRAKVLYRGRTYPVVGRVSMDYIAVDLGPENAVQVGDRVTLIGSEGGARLLAEDLAALAGTIPYELLTGLNPSIERVCRDKIITRPAATPDAIRALSNPAL